MQLGSEGNLQPFLARESENQKFPPIAHPHLVKYLFILQFNHFQKLIDYKVDSALLRDPFSVPLFLFVQKLFRVENRHRKGQSCECLFPILPHFTPNYLFTQRFNFFQNLINYKIDPALSYDIVFVSLNLLIQKLFRVEKYHQKAI